MIKYFSISATLVIYFLTLSGCSTSPESTHNTESNLTYSTVKSEKNTAYFKQILTQIENPERIQQKCDQQKLAEFCYIYAGYQQLILNDSKNAYSYHKKSFDLGRKNSGFYIANAQIYNPELFNDDEKMTLEQSIDYLEQASESDSIDAIRLLMIIYRLPKYNHIDYKKAEYYNKIAIRLNIKNSRFSLASLYTHHMKDKSKIATIINLYKEDLLIDKNWQSSLALAHIYLHSDQFDYGVEQDYVKGLAYAYITRDLHEKSPDKSIKNIEEKIINVMERDFSEKVIQQAKDLYKEIKVEMDAYAESNKE